MGGVQAMLTGREGWERLVPRQPDYGLPSGRRCGVDT